MKTTIKQLVRRKLYNFVKRNVPFRGNFRPQGFYEPEEAAKKFELQGSLYKCIYSNYQTDLVVAKDFFERLSPHAIYDSFTVGDTECILSHTANYEIIKIPNGRLYTNNLDCIAAITPDNKLVARVSYEYQMEAKVDAANNKIFKQRYFIKPQYINGTVFSLLAGNGPTFNIAHWLFDSIPRIHLLKESGLFDKVDYFVVPAYRYDFQKDSLTLLGIPENKIISGKDDLHLIAKNLIISSHPRGERSYLMPKWITEFLRNEYLKYITVDLQSPKHIYISRKDSKLRKVINEDQLEIILARYGFQTIVNSKLSLLEKVKLFHNADVIISASGAGLTSVLFSKEGSTLVELFSEGYVDTAYYDVAIQNGMKYFPLICKNKNPSKNAEQGQLEDLFVNISEIENILAKVFGQK